MKTTNNYNTEINKYNKKTDYRPSSETCKFMLDFTLELLKNMPEDKRETLRAAIRRTALLTSEFNLQNTNVSIYKEGYYITAEGCKSKWSMFVRDNDGEFEYIRKPNENTLHYLYNVWFSGMTIDYYKYI